LDAIRDRTPLAKAIPQRLGICIEFWGSILTSSFALEESLVAAASRSDAISAQIVSSAIAIHFIMFLQIHYTLRRVRRYDNKKRSLRQSRQTIGSV
jgi:hypothetical protein